MLTPRKVNLSLSAVDGDGQPQSVHLGKVVAPATSRFEGWHLDSVSGSA